MLKLMKRFFRYIAPPPPKYDCIPDMTGGHLDMQYLINSMGENKEWPSVGDLVIKLESCSMGMTVRNDKRYRVKAIRTPYSTSFEAAPLGPVFGGEAPGREVLHIFYLRRHTKIPRVWILCN